MTGQVLGGDGTVLAGATVRVALDAADPSYDVANPANNLVATATTDVNGNYAINVGAFRGSGLSVGSIVDVSAPTARYAGVTQYGVYDQAVVICSFLDFRQIRGVPWEDRRLPPDTGQPPPLPFDHLLPDYVGSF